jgi:putative ABC transport system permease protein
MFSNYLKVALRNLIKRRGYSAIVISGLAIGMACCIVILRYVQHELSYDQFNENHDRIYELVAERKTAKGTSMDVVLPPPLATSLLADIPQVEHAVRLLTMDNPVPLVGNGDRRFYEKRLSFVDSSISEVFSIPAIRGDGRKALQRPNTVMITEEVARKYFGDEDALGKTLSLNGILTLEVTAVVKGFPSNSTLQADLLVSFSTLDSWLGESFVGNWQNNTCQIFLLLAPNGSADLVSERLSAVIAKYLGENRSLQKIHLESLDRMHLFSSRDYGLASSGDIQTIYLLSGVALLVLLVACVNFANLTTARLVLRSKEVGVRKLIGATRGQLVQQFLCEASISMLVSLVLAIALVEISLPYLSTLIGSRISAGSASDWRSWLGPTGIVMAIGGLSTVYPASVLSSLKPLESTKGFATAGSRRILLRKIMVVFQFALTVMLLIGTWVVYDQMSFIQNKQLGLNKDQVIVVPIRNENLRQNSEPLKHRLMQNPGIQQVGAAALLPGGPVGRTRFRQEGNLIEGTMSMLWVDRDFIQTLDLKFAAGRGFSADYATDATGAFVINEQAVKQLGWEDPAEAVGKSFELTGGKKGHIIGVVRDFNFTSLHRAIEPLVIHLWPWMNYLLIRVDESRFERALSETKDVYREFDSMNPFTFAFLNDNFDRFYQSDRQLGKIFGYFGLLAMLIACSGLVSLAAFAAEQRTKEIGVRKVLGASIPGIIGLLTREYLLLVMLANLLAWPVAYYVMNRWLQDFAYRVNIGVVTFLIAGAVSVLIAMLTVSYQALRAAVANPVEALRYE